MAARPHCSSPGPASLGFFPSIRPRPASFDLRRFLSPVHDPCVESAGEIGVRWASIGRKGRIACGYERASNGHTGVVAHGRCWARGEADGHARKEEGGESLGAWRILASVAAPWQTPPVGGQDAVWSLPQIRFACLSPFGSMRLACSFSAGWHAGLRPFGQRAMASCEACHEPPQPAAEKAPSPTPSWASCRREASLWRSPRD